MSKSISNYVLRVALKHYLTNNNIEEDIGSEGLLEICSEVAEKILEEEHPDVSHWTEDASGDAYLKEESQDLYNEYYADVMVFIADIITRPISKGIS